MAKIGLINVDKSSFPNLALGKIATYHKSLGDSVEWVQPLFSEYDRIYMSKVFTFTPDYEYELDCDEVIKGGTGYDIYSQLPPEIDRLQPDYSIYGIKGTSYGFTTRGCVNKCSFCIVPKKEGLIRPYMDIEEIANGNKNLVLMDNNIIAHPHGLNSLKIAIDKGYRLDCNQGLDSRLITDEIAEILAKVKWIKYIRTACDSSAQISHIEKAHELLQKYGYNGEIFCYCLIKDFKESIERIQYLRRHKDWLLLHCQPWRDFNNPYQIIPLWQKDLARYTNRKWIYKSCELEDFEPRKGFLFKEYFNQEHD